MSAEACLLLEQHIRDTVRHLNNGNPDYTQLPLYFKASSFKVSGRRPCLCQAGRTCLPVLLISRDGTYVNGKPAESLRCSFSTGSRCIVALLVAQRSLGHCS